MRKRFGFVWAAILVLTMMFGGSVYAFSDIQGDPNEADIAALHKSGVLSGVKEGTFAPKGKVTMAQGVAMLVKAFDLNIDSIRFIREPKASDYFTKVPDDAWYANAFVIAHLNGLPVPKDADPTQSLTREQFAHLLYHALSKKGEYAFIEIWIMIKDEKDINQDYMTSIQRLLIGKIVELDDGGYFHPKAELTRSEAARLLHKALRFVKEQKPIPPQPPIDGKVTMSVTKVNEEVNKVTLTWGEMPNPGYRIVVTGIEFTPQGEAVIAYELREPEPGKMYPQVITEAKVDTFVATSYKPVLKSPN